MTAVEWFAKQVLRSRQLGFISNEKFNELLEQAKEMEKVQHKETFKQSRQAKIFEKDMPPVWESWEQYYNQTFKVNPKNGKEWLATQPCVINSKRTK